MQFSRNGLLFVSHHDHFSHTQTDTHLSLNALMGKLQKSQRQFAPSFGKKIAIHGLHSNADCSAVALPFQQTASVTVSRTDPALWRTMHLHHAVNFQCCCFRWRDHLKQLLQPKKRIKSTDLKQHRLWQSSL